MNELNYILKRNSRYSYTDLFQNDNEVWDELFEKMYMYIEPDTTYIEPFILS